jgi:hypothetical protein
MSFVKSSKVSPVIDDIEGEQKIIVSRLNYPYCNKKMYDGKSIFIGTIIFLAASIMYGMIVILIVRDNGFKFQPIDILYSIPIGMSLIFTVFYIIKCICCPKDNFSLLEAVCKK